METQLRDTTINQQLKILWGRELIYNYYITPLGLSIDSLFFFKKA